MRDVNFERFDDLLGLSCSTDGNMFRYKCPQVGTAGRSGRQAGRQAGSIHQRQVTDTRGAAGKVLSSQ